MKDVDDAYAKASDDVFIIEELLELAVVPNKVPEDVDVDLKSTKSVSSDPIWFVVVEVNEVLVDETVWQLCKDEVCANPSEVDDINFVNNDDVSNDVHDDVVDGEIEFSWELSVTWFRASQFEVICDVLNAIWSSVICVRSYKVEFSTRESFFSFNFSSLVFFGKKNLS